MNKLLRKTVIAGNWKMNRTRTEAAALIKEIIPEARGAGCEVVICVPFTNLETAVSLVEGTSVKVGAQNCHYKDKGAFTGEISAPMLAEIGVEYVIIGHSERRQYFGETDLTVNRRAKAALKAGLKVIVCVGETLTEREENITEQVLKIQTRAALTDISAEDIGNVIIAYEPVWAIGTGRTASDEQAEEACAFVRGVIESEYDRTVSGGITIQYGGSMNAGNVAGLLAMENIDGGLIGGASLSAKDFGVIIKAADR